MQEMKDIYSINSQKYRKVSYIRILFVEANKIRVRQAYTCALTFI